MDRLAEEGCWITTAWTATLRKPSRAMILTGRHAHRQKWWSNNDIARVPHPGGWMDALHIYDTSPLLLSHLASGAGYGTYWVGKFHLSGDYSKYGFDEAMITPGMLHESTNPHSDFQLDTVKEGGERIGLRNLDTGELIEKKTYAQDSWYWQPNVRLWNDPSAPGELVWWPNTPKAKASFGLNVYGPDLETGYCLDFMERKHEEGKPFFVYHPTHLGHGAFDWFHPESGNKWPGTPVVKWDGERYHRKPLNITGSNGVYETNETVTEPGLHSHINYIDYMLWRYVEKVKELGIEENTIFVFSTDNGSHKFGKTKVDQQRGTHVPLIIYAPGMTKQGEQGILVSLTDFLPTFADIMGYEFPADYELDGKSLWSFLTTNEPKHHDWIYSYKSKYQMVRGKYLIRDGFGKWWDAKELPEDHRSYQQISDWNQVPETYRDEREQLEKVLTKFDLYETEYDAPK